MKYSLKVTFILSVGRQFHKRASRQPTPPSTQQNNKSSNNNNNNGSGPKLKEEDLVWTADNTSVYKYEPAGLHVQLHQQRHHMNRLAPGEWWCEQHPKEPTWLPLRPNRLRQRWSLKILKSSLLYTMLRCDLFISTTTRNCCDGEERSRSMWGGMEEEREETRAGNRPTRSFRWCVPLCVWGCCRPLAV